MYAGRSGCLIGSVFQTPGSGFPAPDPGLLFLVGLFPGFEFVELTDGLAILGGDLVHLVAEHHVLQRDEPNWDGDRAEQADEHAQQQAIGYGLGQALRSKEQTRRMARQAMGLYNHCRPHLALKMTFPITVHQVV